MTITETITHRAATLTPSERRIAEVVLADPRVVAFGTVGELAALADTSGPSVVRFAVKLGFEGYVDLQASVQEEISAHLRPAVDRIRERPATDPLRRSRESAEADVRATLGAVTPKAFDDAVGLLADRRRRVFVVASEASRAVGIVLADGLAMLRDGVENVTGSPIRVSQTLALASAGDVVVVIDLPRYERWVTDAVTQAHTASAEVIALTDGPLSPLGAGARQVFAVSGTGAGPFDSQVGGVALAEALVNGTATRLRPKAVERLDTVERAWTETGALLPR